MADNYTPLEPSQEKKETGDSLSTVLLFILTLATAILAILLFVLIRNKSKNQTQQSLPPTDVVSPTTIVPTFDLPTPDYVPSPSVTTTEKIASPSPTI